jgi:opacity protein-like surface antigen
MKQAFTIAALLCLLAGAAQAAEADRPHWSVEIKGGLFYPEIEDWERFYGSNHTSQYGVMIGFKPLRWMDVGIETGYIRDKGQGYAPLNDLVTGAVTYELAPVSVVLLLRGVFSEDQWLVPYVGGGYTRMYYREKIEGQATIRGSADGTTVRAGIQLAIDALDPGASNSLYLEYGIEHTYLFFEAQKTKVVVGTPEVDIGGISYLAGLLFEF